MKKNILVFICFFCLTFIVSYFHPVNMDEIITYGFSYNISNGMIPYKDFNMVIGPLYPMLLSLSVSIFGNYYIFYLLENSLIYSIIFTFLYKKIGKKSIYILLFLGCQVTMNSYNAFCAMLMISMLMLLDSKFKYKEYLIGLLIAVIFFTKQNIGLALLFAYFINVLLEKKKIIKSTLIIIISFIPMFVYLLVNNIFDKYIDFCFLGMGSFLDNYKIDLIPFFMSLFFIFYLIKKYICTKDIKIIYLLAFQTVLIPIIDVHHVLISLIPIYYYYFTTNENLKYNYIIKLMTIIYYIILTGLSIFLSSMIIKDNYLKYMFASEGFMNTMDNFSSYIDEHDEYKIYLLTVEAYSIKLYRNEKMGFYDLINTGNLGSNEKKYVDMMAKDCSNKKCLFIMEASWFDNTKYYQCSEIFKEYILENYYYVETLPIGERVYSNEKLTEGD